MILLLLIPAIYLFVGFVYAIYCCFDNGQFDLDIGGGWVPWWFAWPFALFGWPVLVYGAILGRIGKGR
jgi:hypothetical protein